MGLGSKALFSRRRPSSSWPHSFSGFYRLQDGEGPYEGIVVFFILRDRSGGRSARYSTERLVELLAALSGCPVIRSAHGGPAAHSMSLSGLVSNSSENPTPSSSKFSRLTAIDLRLRIVGLGPAKERSELFELVGHERASAFRLLDFA